MKKVAIVGNGWVGTSMQELFPHALTYVRDYDKALKEGKIFENYAYTDDRAKINKADFVFICVPTPNPENGKLDTSAVEEVIAWLENDPLIVIRSTVNPGDCETWVAKYGKRIIFQPEYLGETPNHPLLDESKTPFMILGGIEQHVRELIDLYTHVYNANIRIRRTTLYEAEVIKLTENRAIAFKVAQCQELYDVCEKAGVDYYTIRDAVYGDDPRMNLWWTLIMPEKRGFISKCIPKDVYAWAAWAESVGYPPILTGTMLAKNKEWIAMNGGEVHGQN